MKIKQSKLCILIIKEKCEKYKGKVFKKVLS